jgi:hypothetical protein
LLASGAFPYDACVANFSSLVRTAKMFWQNCPGIPDNSSLYCAAVEAKSTLDIINIIDFVCSCGRTFVQVSCRETWQTWLRNNEQCFLANH